MIVARKCRSADHPPCTGGPHDWARLVLEFGYVPAGDNLRVFIGPGHKLFNSLRILAYDRLQDFHAQLWIEGLYMR